MRWRVVGLSEWSVDDLVRIAQAHDKAAQDLRHVAGGVWYPRKRGIAFDIRSVARAKVRHGHK